MVSVTRSLFLWLGLFIFSIQTWATTVPPVARSHREFMDATIEKYRQARENNFARIGPDCPAEMPMAIEALISKIAQPNGLTEQLDNPEPIFFCPRLDELQEDIPRANINTGIISMNIQMLMLIENDDELAAVIGHELLHHTLGHDLKVIEAVNSWANWLLGKLSKGPSNPIVNDQNWAYQIRVSRIEALKDENEHEVDRALPILLQNAGFDPWAIVNLNDRLMKATADAPPVFLDGYTRQKLLGRHQSIRAEIMRRGFPMRSNHGKELLNFLHEDLQR